MRLKSKSNGLVLLVLVLLVLVDDKGGKYRENSAFGEGDVREILLLRRHPLLGRSEEPRRRRRRRSRGRHDEAVDLRADLHAAGQSGGQGRSVRGLRVKRRRLRMTGERFDAREDLLLLATKLMMVVDAT